MKSEDETKQVEVSSSSIVCNLRITEVRISKHFPTRVTQVSAVTKRYAEAMKGGVKFPKVIVYDDGENKWLADGKLRVTAAGQAGMTEIEAEVRKGSERDAFVCSLEANGAHGSPLTNADKRNGVTLLLSDSEWCQWSDVQLSKLCGVSDKFVGKMRRLTSNGSKSRKCIRNGKEIEIRTARIGTAKSNKKIAAPMPILPAPEPAISGSEQNGSLPCFEDAQTVTPIHVVTVGDVVGVVALDSSLTSEVNSLEKFPGERHFNYVAQAGSAGEASEKVQSFCEAVVKLAESYGMIVEFERDSVHRNSRLLGSSVDSEVITA